MKSESMNLKEVATEDLVAMLRHVSVETGSLTCLGCGHEHNCGTRGCALIREAADRLDASRAPTLTPPNEPLTLAELREMDGKPVYVVIDDGFEPLKMWALVDYIKEEQCLTLTNNLGGRSQYYTADDLEIDHITAYRRPPEGEGDIK